MIVDCAHYRDGCRQGVGPVPVEEAAARHREGGFVWLGMFEPAPDELDRVRECFAVAASHAGRPMSFSPARSRAASSASA